MTLFSLLHSLQPLQVLSGLGVGVLVGLTGVGGGSLMTPLLVLVFGIHASTAVGTDLLYASATKAVGTGVHNSNNTVDWRIVGRLALGSVPAAALTLWMLSHLGKAADARHGVITYTLGAALILTAVAVLFRTWLLRQWAQRVGALPSSTVVALTVLLGAVLGVLVSLTSVGAGAIGMTVLLMLYPNLETRRLIGSDIAHAVPLTLIAGFGHWMMGKVDTLLLASLLVGSIPGIIIGSQLAAKAPDRMLRPVLAAVLLLVGAKLVT